MAATGAQGSEGCGFYSGMMTLCGFCMFSRCLWFSPGFPAVLHSLVNWQLWTWMWAWQLQLVSLQFVSMLWMVRWHWHLHTSLCILFFSRTAPKRSSQRAAELWRYDGCFLMSLKHDCDLCDVIMRIMFCPLLLSFNPDLPSVLWLNWNTSAIETGLMASPLYLTIEKSVKHSTKYLFLQEKNVCSF